MTLSLKKEQKKMKNFAYLQDRVNTCFVDTKTVVLNNFLYER